MRPNPYLASLLSLLVPGLGQIYARRGEHGARILFAAIVIGNLNVIWLSIHGLVPPGQTAFWASGLPRLLHDVFAVWAVVFWAWAVFDAYGQARDRQEGP